MQPGEIYYYHLRLGEKGGAITFAFTQLTSGWIQYSYSLCSPKDQFRKHWGREISAQRLCNERQKRVNGFRPETGEERPAHIQVAANFFAEAGRGAEFVVQCGWLQKYVKAQNNVLEMPDPLNNDAVNQLLKEIGNMAEVDSVNTGG
jgi:hypothetical protein